MLSAELEQKGKVLRQNIDARYEHLKKNRLLQTRIEMRGKHEESPNNISDIVAASIPVGSSFDVAENVLRGAGFTIDPRPSKDLPGDRPDKHDVVGHIRKYGSVLFGRVGLYVHLTPTIPGNYSNIAKIYGAFAVSTL